MSRTAPAVLGVLVLVLAACTPSGTTPPAQQLAADQTLSFPISQDLSSLDPALLTNPGDIDILRNVFSGLYRFDDALHEVPDLAVGQPAVSPDGLTYTFHIRHDAKFSNGDPITAGDVIYSWDRAAARQGDYAWLFGSIAGDAGVAAGRAVHLSGLSKPDDYTVVVTLVKAAGDFISQVGLWPYWLVDQKVITSAGQDAWFATPQTLVGSGPFMLTSWVHGRSMDFTPVPGWYGGRTGSITRVHVEVQPDPATQLAQYESGVYSLVGYARQGLSSDAAKKYTADLELKKQLTLDPLGVTYWVGYNLKTGPFAGDAGRDGRRSFSLAIDRAALADAVCNHRTGCAAANGGLISKGLQGYLGDGVDLNARFDAAGAKSLYAAWDPDGSKVKGLTYTYDTSVVNKLVCDNLAAQWKQNLGVTVACVELDRKTFLADRNGSCAYTLFRQSWSADYDHPRDWFDHLFAGGANSSGSCYANTSFDQLVAAADSGSLEAGMPGYRTAGQMLVEDAAFAPLLYDVQPYLVQPYVRGAGGNALYDFSWTSALIVKH